jgi:hypothetical protein
MSSLPEKPKPKNRAGMVTGESALRKGWPIAEEKPQEQLLCVQAVLGDPVSSDRARWRAAPESVPS